MLPSTQLGAQRFLNELGDDSTSSSDSSDSAEEDYRIKAQRNSVQPPQQIQQAAQRPVEVIVISSGEESSGLEEEEEEDEDEDEVGQEQERSAACESGNRDDECELLQNINNNNNNNQTSPQQSQHASGLSDRPVVDIDGPLAAAIEEYSKSDNEEKRECYPDAFDVQIQQLAKERPRLRMLGIGTMGSMEGDRKAWEVRDDRPRMREIHHASEEGSHERDLSGGPDNEQRLSEKLRNMGKEDETLMSEEMKGGPESESGQDEEEHEVKNEADQEKDSESYDSSEADQEEDLIGCRRLEESELDKSKAMLMAGIVSGGGQKSNTPLEQSPWLQNKQEGQELLEKTLELEKRSTIARIQKSTIGTGVLEAGRAAQIRRGVQPRDRVISGRITKPAKSTRPSNVDMKASLPKIELSGRQQLLNVRAKVKPRDDARRLKQDNHVVQPNGKTKRAKRSKRNRLNRALKKQKHNAAREGDGAPKQADRNEEPSAKMKKVKKHRQQRAKEMKKSGFKA